MAVAQGRGTACFATFVFAVVAALCCCTASATVWTVGDSSGWEIGVNYTTWASGKTFKLGDVLFFPYAQSNHDVVVVNKTGHDSCTSSPSNTVYTAGNTNITLNVTGSSYYLCSFSSHCTSGMKLAVNVVAATSPPPAPAPAPAPSSPSPTVWTVGGSSGWNLGVNYTSWASGKTFKKEDVLFFPYAQSNHDVVVVNKTGYDTCTSSPSNTVYTAGNTNITLNATGSSYYICTFPSHCTSGMRLAVNAAAGTSPTPAPAPAPSSLSPSPAPGSPPTKAPASSPTNGPTPSPASTATPPTPASSTTPSSGPPPPGSPSSPSPPGPAPSSAPRLAAAAGGVAAVLSIMVGSALLL